MLIKVENLNRNYEYFEKKEGLKESFKSLIKREKKVKRAVKDFSFTMEKGEILGLIGPNGAGKTTLIKMMTGIIKPTSGRLIVDGFVPSELRTEFKKKYSVVMGQKSQLWWDLPAVDSFHLNKKIYGIPDIEFDERLSYLVDIFQVSEFLNVQVRKLSLGQRMKMEIILSLLHNPEIMFLDEPTIGLDMIAQKQMRIFLKEVNQRLGVSIILTSHYMEDIKELCKRVIVINEGEKIFDDSYETLIMTKGQDRIIKIRFEKSVDKHDLSKYEILERTPFKLEMKVKKTEVNDLIMELLREYPIEDISIEDEDISDVIEKLYNSKVAV